MFLILYILQYKDAILAQTWTKVGNQFTFNTATLPKINIAQDGTVYIAYKEGRSSGSFSEKLSVVRWMNDQWSPVGGYGILSKNITEFDFALDRNNIPYIVFATHDAGGVSRKANVVKYVNTNWHLTNEGHRSGCACPEKFFTQLDFNEDQDPIEAGAISDTKVSVSEGITKGLALHFNCDNKLFAGFTDGSSGNRVCIKHWNDTLNNWMTTGNRFVTDGPASIFSMASDRAGMIYVAYNDDRLTGGVSVKFFNGNNWEYVGMPSFSPLVVGSLSLALDEDDRPVVAFVNNAAGKKLSVMKFDGDEWNYLGNSLSVGGVSNVSVSIGTNNTIYVSYRENDLGYKNFVSKFENGVWISVVNSMGLPEGTNTTNYNQLAISKISNTLYTTFTAAFKGELWKLVEEPATHVDAIVKPDLKIIQNKSMLIFDDLEYGTLLVYNQLGILIKRFDVNKSDRIEMSLNKGVYIIKNNQRIVKLSI